MSKTILVPHLGGIEASYRVSEPYRQDKPTVVMINSFATDHSLYSPQFSNSSLTEVANLLAISPLGHGKTKIRGGNPAPGGESENQNFTYWDTAIMNLQVMDLLGVKQAFVLGTSQGGWMAVRMALVAPKRIVGLMPLGTSMDSESDRSRALGCWDVSGVTPVIESLTSSTATADFELPDEFCDYSVSQGFGADCPAETRAQWIKITKANYQGDAGRKRIREAAVNLRDRDGLHGRLANVKCPVLWLHGDKDVVYSVANAKEEIKLFTGSADAKVAVVKGGHHYLSWTNGKEVDAALTGFVRRVSKGTKAIARY